MGVDILLAVPFQPITAHAIDPTVRQSVGAYVGAPLAEAVAEFEEYLGHSLDVLQWKSHPAFGDALTKLPPGRSLTAVALATHLQREGLRWEAVDPGEKELRYWRRCFEQRRASPPRVVALSTSYIMSASWLKALCALVRRTLPDSTLVVGGSFYTTAARDFLALDADVFCIGEGEHRLPRIVKAIGAGGALDEIPGLYLRNEDGTLRHTGTVEPLDLNELSPPDWGLSLRMEPPLQFGPDLPYCVVETQRGCCYACRFCTFRTVTPHVKMCAERAAEALCPADVMPGGSVFIADATASSPRSRWEAILTLLAERGAPHPIIGFTRVSDVNDQTAELMARAGVRGVVIGQESGDQRILDAMNKGVRVEQVAPAVAALARHGVGAQFAFLYGFPGETTDSTQATRTMITNLNVGFETSPVVPSYVLIPFQLFDFAAVARNGELGDVHHPMGYTAADFTPRQVAEEMLATLIAGSRVPHAPLCSSVFNALPDFLFNIPDVKRRNEIFRWLKAFERGVGMFLERNLDGTKPDAAELKRLREAVLAECEPRSALRSALTRMVARGRARQSRRIRDEWQAEPTKGPGRLTRGYAAFCAYRDFGRLGDARHAWRTGTYPDVGSFANIDNAALDQAVAELVGEA